jgi:polyhydroxybutyrate depolymerase
VARGNTTTRWIIAGAAAVVVVAASVVVIVLSLREDPPTERVSPTSAPTTGPTSTAVPTTRPGQGTTTTEPAEVDETDETITVGELQRRYKVVAPRDIEDDEELPTVIVLHGLGVSAEGISRAGDWRQAVERDRFLAVFPQGEANSWNMGPCCLPASLVGVDDESFLEEVVALLQERPDVDEERMYLSGFSNGALMVYDFTCSHPGVFAAIAPMAGSNLSRCTPQEPTSLLHQHSDPDSVVPYDGGISFGQLIAGADFPDVPGSVARWAEDSGCDPRPESSEDADVERFTWTGCPDGVEVELIRVPDKGHVWLDRGDFDSLEAVLEFFELS